MLKAHHFEVKHWDNLKLFFKLRLEPVQIRWLFYRTMIRPPLDFHELRRPIKGNTKSRVYMIPLILPIMVRVKMLMFTKWNVSGRKVRNRVCTALYHSSAGSRPSRTINVLQLNWLRNGAACKGTPRVAGDKGQLRAHRARITCICVCTYLHTHMLRVDITHTHAHVLTDKRRRCARVAMRSVR